MTKNIKIRIFLALMWLAFVSWMLITERPELS